jgi:hypothetical protein
VQLPVQVLLPQTAGPVQQSGSPLGGAEGQTMGAPAQLPFPSQASLVVQALPSLQETPLATGVETQSARPLEELHAEVLHWLDSQTTPWQGST